jgi:uncharacterized protein with HEPN domain
MARLQEILAFLDRIERGLRALGIATLDAYRQNEMAQDILERNLLRVAEAAAKLGIDRLEQAQPTAPWRSLLGLANRLRHAYDHVNHVIAWDTHAADLPKVRAAILAEIARLQSQSGP